MGGYFKIMYYADPEEGLIGILMKQTWRPKSNIQVGNCVIKLARGLIIELFGAMPS